MEKFYDLIPSETIRNLCKEQKCELAALECLLLVNQCKKISLEEKHALYNEIMETMPEPDVPDDFRQQTNTELSLYEIVREYMRLEKADLENFLKDANEPVYGYDRTTLSEAIANLDKTMFREIENNKIGYTATFLANGEIESIWTHTYRPYTAIFDYIVELPVPFKKGDILGCCPTDKGYAYLCIFDSLVENNKRGCASHANVYTVFTNGCGIQADIIPCSLLDYYAKELRPYEKIYKIISDYFKGEIDFEVFLNSYLILVKEYEFKKERRLHLDDYIEELFPEEQSEDE